MSNGININEIRKEIEEMGKTKKENTFTVNIPNERKLVKFSFSAKDSFARFEAVKEAQNCLSRAIENTGGSMPTELIDTYEGLNSIMERIKDLELGIVKYGR